MTPDQLRALADALRPMAKAPCFDGIDIEHAADYLRAQADAQPVAWMYEHDGCVDTPLVTVNRWTKCEEPWNESPLFLHPAPAVPAGWKWVPVEPTPEMLDEGCDVDARAEVIKKYAAMPVIRNPENCCSCGEVLAVQYRAMLAAAPAAPQAEPIDPHMIVADDRFPDAQAEPKREPLSDEQIIPDDLKLQFAVTAALRDVLLERRRQVEVEGWTPEHDDEHDAGELAAAGAAYAEVAVDEMHPMSHGDGGYMLTPPALWPFDGTWWRPSRDQRRNLVKAGALILAEIERLDRMGGSDAE